MTFDLNGKKKVQIKNYKGMILIDIWEYWVKDSGQVLPTKKGVSITKDVWQKLKAIMPHIDEAIKRFDSGEGS